MAQGYWEYQSVTTSEFKTLNPQVQFDRWGNTHVMWSTRDPKRSGLQLFYSNNGSGHFAAPVQVTDTGTVFDSTNAALSSFVFQLDSTGIAHVAFVANVENHLRLYYTSNSNGRFDSAFFLAERTHYGMAVDSLGRAHVVWVDDGSNVINLHYWSTTAPDVERLVGSLACSQFRYGCRVGDVEVESGVNGVMVAVSADSGSIYHLQLPLGSLKRASIPGYDQFETWSGRADLRFRMALDADGAMHLLMPRVSQNGRHRMMYATNASGLFINQILVDTLAAQPLGFDLAFNGAGKVIALWTAETQSAPAVTGIAEIARPKKLWAVQSITRDIEPQLTTGQGVWKRALRLLARGDKLVIAGLARPSMDREEVVSIITRTGIGPTVAYFHPDAAAAGMSVVVEAIAPSRDKGSFGRDGFHGDTVALQLRNTYDSSRVVVGPSVVSWDGRLISAMLFVRPGAAAGPVPLVVRVGSLLSNADTFQIVVPQHLGDAAGVLDVGGALGSGGKYGTRSRRGVMVVDSLHLRSGVFRVDTSDIDPVIPGNQGFLPITLLSVGPVRIDSLAELTVSAAHDVAGGRFGSAGAGGGGGGSGGWISGGSGFAGGAGPGRFVDGPIGASISSGLDVRSSRWGGGPSLNGVPGGAAYPEAPGGGASGHPFGTSGSFGRTSEMEPTRRDAGGNGGATAGSQSIVFMGPTTGGGGGGNSSGGDSGNERSEIVNGGARVGSRPLVPLAGGSGGGGGGFSTNGIASGGGGGGALALFSFDDITIAGVISADGARGVGDVPMTNSSGGGGGAGGGVIVGAQGEISFVGNGRITAKGATGGAGHTAGGRDGGRGSDGRIRIDGRAGAGAAQSTFPQSAYSGPATSPNGSIVARDGAFVRGTGEPGRTIHAFVRTESTRWNYSKPLTTTVRTDSTWQVRLGSEAVAGKLYVVAMQRIDDPRRDAYTAEPEWVMSAAGANIIGRPAISLSKRDHRFACIKFSERDSAIVWLRNSGQLSDLEIRDVRIDGLGKAAFASDYRGAVIAPGDSIPLIVRFTPADTGTYKAVVSVVTNITPDSIATISLEGCAVAGTLVANVAQLDVGAVCAGDTIHRAITLRNVGDVPVRIDEIRGDDGIVEVVALNPGMPLTLSNWGDSVVVSVSFVVLRFDASEMRLRIESDAENKRIEIPVIARDSRPVPIHVGALVFKSLNLSATDTCDVRSIWIRNASATETLEIGSASLSVPSPFTLLSSLSGVSLPPGDSIEVVLGFCTQAVGDYLAQLRISFGSGSCALTTSVTLTGRATEGEAALSVRYPFDKRIELMQTLLGSVSPADSVVVRNDGEVAGRLAIPVIEVGANTFDGEFTVAATQQYPISIGKDASIRLDVVFRPLSIGRKSASIILVSEDGVFRDTVHVSSTGAEPGIVTSFGSLDFGDVRVGSTSTSRVLTILNASPARDVVTSLTAPDNAAFVIERTDRSLPATLDSGDALNVIIHYAPGAEVRDNDSLVIHTALRPASTVSVLLGGRGVLEHAMLRDTLVDFGTFRRNSDVARPGAFVVVNNGTYPLTIYGATIAGSSLFEWLGTPPEFPMSVAADGGFASFSLRYYAAATNSATIQLQTSANTPEDLLRVYLVGAVIVDPDTAIVSIPLTTGRVGNRVSIPIGASLSNAVTDDVTYSFTARFESGLLAPRGIASGAVVLPSDLEGTISATARWDSVAPGVVRVTGTLKAGALSGVVINLPMLVLTGPPASSAISIEGASMSGGPGYVVNVAPGVFYGIDCDTGRGVIVKGRYELTQNNPNPINESTVVRFSVAAREHVRINLYNSSGLLVRVLVDEVMDEGSYLLGIDASSIDSGIYTYEMISGPYREVRRMVVVD